MPVRPVLAVLERELLKLSRQRTRLVAALVRPLIWLLVIGSGMGAVVQFPGAADVPYRQFLAPGVVAMTLLFGAMLSALTMVYDKESGVMRMLVVAPFAHGWIVVAKAAAAAVSALAQALLLVLALALLGDLPWATTTLVGLGGALVLGALACAALGMLVATFTRTLDNFAALMNFVIFPVFFLSGALYPLDRLPDWLRLAGRANPFSYAVDLLKHALLGAGGSRPGAEFAVTTDVAVLVGFTVVALTVACLRFSGEGAFAPVLRTLTTRRGG
ncbi:MAG: ABC transporter permease [Burkholderiales bacterium]|jgi:ABC-2 type transport system permease protein|nr:ABC transporter permease [Burkholderiales bacterium]